MSTEDIEFGYGTFYPLDVGPAATAVPEDIANRLYNYYTQLDPTVFNNINNPAIQNPSFGGQSGDTAITAETLMQFKNLYKPEELNSIVDSYIEQTGDKETGAILKNLFGSDTTLSDTAIAEAGKIPVGEGDITTVESGGIADFFKKLGAGFKDLTGISGSDALKYASMAGIAKMAYDDAKKAREEAKGTPFKSSAPYQAVTGPGGVTGFKRAAAGGGIGSLDLARGGRALPPRYLNGHSDGMADKVPAHIDNRRPAALSDGEFVIPADVVSHLGNGNSNAGAKRLYKMMDRIRAARTGNPKQGKQINPDKFLPR